ncbi:MAG: hypothetical protein AAGH79_01190 [Bacteroidota bacterium]
MGARTRYTIILLTLSVSTILAQSPSISNLRTTTIQKSTDWIVVDSLAILPSTLMLADGTSIPAEVYQTQGGSILMQASWWEGRPDSLTIQYRLFPEALPLEVVRIDTSLQTREEKVGGLTYDPFANTSPVEFSGIDYNGAFARGIAFGNNQNLVLNSSFNLQMAGVIGDGIELQAAITDENIPIQPEGNTQQLSEFDRIYITLKKGGSQLTAGDYELARPGGYFMNYFKKLSGATFSHEQALFSRGLLRFNASAALARGQFARNVILGQEGNQGPYRLEGAEGEQFIIVLAGTEKVYLDGELLVRGIEDDYIIDYNRGDITFTNRRLITKDSRIIFEFEYNDQSFQRSLTASNLEYQQGNFRAYANWYTEQDGRTLLGEGPLSAEQLDILAQAGDDPLQAVVSSIDTFGINADPISYRRIDTLVNGILNQDILVYTPDTTLDQTLFVARFSDVGLGNGNYIRPASVANGIVYQWVSPDPILGPQGQFEPISQIPTPSQVQMSSAGMEWTYSERGKIQVEAALSKRDENRFSELDREDDYGLGTYLNWEQGFNLGKAWKGAVRGQAEVIDQNFRALNPYRKAEFIRDWSINDQTRVLEQIYRGGWELRNDSLGANLSYQLSSFDRQNAYRGYKHDAEVRWQKAGWFARVGGSYLDAQDLENSSQFFRPRVTLEKTFAKLANWSFRFYGEREQNTQRDLQQDTLQANSFYWDLYRFTLSSPELEKVQTSISYVHRKDFAPLASGWQGANLAREASVKGRWVPGRFSRWTWDLTYRNLQVLDTLVSQSEPAETYLGRIDYNLLLAKGAVRYNNTYQISSGQEQKLLFIYQRVNPGEGIYQHLDFNEDGIEQNNEFVIAPNSDQGTHVRVVIYTNEFVRTNNVQFNQSLRLDPKAIWFQKEGILKLLSRFSTTSIWQINRKVRDLEDVSAWNPFQLDVADTALVSTRTIIQNSLFLNRADPVFNAQISWTDNQGKLLLTTGLESRRTDERSIQFRWNWNRQWSWQMEASEGNRSNLTENFLDRNYNIRFWKLDPTISWQPNQQFRMAIAYGFEQANNELEGATETGTFHAADWELTWNQATKSSLRTTFTFTQIDFSGDPESPVGFAFLNGLQPGNNFQWSITWDRQLAKNIRLGLNYEGRKTGAVRVIHVGRAQVAATF